MMLLHLLSRLHATGTSAPSITLLRVSFFPHSSPTLLPHAPNPSILRPSSTLCSSPFVFLQSLPHVTQVSLVYAGPRPLLAGVAMIMVARRVRWGGLPCRCEVARSSWLALPTAFPLVYSNSNLLSHLLCFSLSPPPRPSTLFLLQ